MKKKISIVKTLAFIFCLIFALIWIAPLAQSLLTSLKSEKEIKMSGFSFLPQNFTFESYTDLFSTRSDSTPIIKWFINSLITSTASTALVLLISSTSAFAYARLKFKGRNLLFGILMATMVFPSVINLIPLYKICAALNMINTKWALILPGASGAFNIFLIRQFMLGIPKELDEAARIDGANYFQIYYKIILPLCAPVLTVVGMFAFTGSWNDFLWPTLVISNVDKMTITPGMQILKGTYDVYPSHAMAGGIVSVIPTFVLFLFAQKYFIKGMQLQSAVKG
ncbi:multiple sugar transport system permease protein [Butyrivibrio fibrisolvens]|uniref:Multiple sugar transport system permease protein n=1 Tax=Butyrivibrio fibrisolvens TaxID=831 RepID=A0A1H9R2A6_BUTFI|nr:carbohydrate ABC transporter permease [Butyrivibrio fibrisolvens]SER66866.1 multiple sugar transport system permease protein [Butyrivibrio fibrisolvens]